jgi:hypothetical protein
VSKTMLVEFRGKGFWAYDVVGAVLLKHMIDAAQQIAHQPDMNWLQEVITQWQISAGITDYGFYLDDDWSQTQMQMIQNLLNKAQAQLSQRDYFTGSEIQTWQLVDGLQIWARGHEVIPTARVIRLGQGILALLQNQMDEPPTGTWWFYGLAEKRETIQMSF